MAVAGAPGCQWGHSQVMPKCPSLCSLPSAVTLPNKLQGSIGQQKPVPGHGLCRAPVLGARVLWERSQGVWEHGGDALTHTPNVCHSAFVNPN